MYMFLVYLNYPEKIQLEIIEYLKIYFTMLAKKLKKKIGSKKILTLSLSKLKLLIQQ